MGRHAGKHALIGLLTLAGCDALPGDDPSRDMGVDATHVGPLSPTPACPIGDASTPEEAAADVRRVAACLGIAIGPVDCAPRDIWLNIDRIERRDDGVVVGFELLECDTTSAPRQGMGNPSTLRYRGTERTIPRSPYRVVRQGDEPLPDLQRCYTDHVTAADSPEDPALRIRAMLDCVGPPFNDATSFCWGPLTDRDTELDAPYFYCRVDFHHFEIHRLITIHPTSEAN